ncbi:hypothetical protein N9D31_03475 [Oligoflexaceae bacterium]|nr:hypothetical protein [Oligoflexaceae bacterium]
MRSIFQKFNLLLSISIFCSVFIIETAFAVSEHKKSVIGYTKDPSVFKASLLLETHDQKLNLNIPTKKLLKRIKYSSKDPRIEPVQLNLFTDLERLQDLAIDLSKSGKSKRLYKYFRGLMQGKTPQPNQDWIRSELSMKALAWLDLNKLSELYRRPHHRITVKSESLQESKRKRSELKHQLSSFMSERDISRILGKISKGEDLVVENDLLSGFARKMTGQYTIFQGPNCFHAALAFHDQKLTRSPFLNVKIEKGYHRAMINYDELWKTISHYFYEISPKKTALEYGDLLVFMDVPDESRKPYFKWIRHASTYLFGEYTFSKGSKSSNTPYSIKTLKDEWKTWQGYSKNLRVKVFRRNQNHVNKRPPLDLTDWIY